MSKDSDGTLIHSGVSTRGLGRALQVTVYSSVATLSLPFLPVNEPMQMDTSSLSETEAIWEVGFLERHKTDGQGVQSPSFFEYDGEVLTSE